MKAIVKQQKTGYYVTCGEFDATYRDDEGHMWFSKAIAREHAMKVRGMYYDGNRSTIKEVVIGYTEA